MDPEEVEDVREKRRERQNVCASICVMVVETDGTVRPRRTGKGSRRHLVSPPGTQYRDPSHVGVWMRGRKDRKSSG